jgi:hypothetical protein
MSPSERHSNGVGNPIFKINMELGISREFGSRRSELDFLDEIGVSEARRLPGEIGMSQIVCLHSIWRINFGSVFVLIAAPRP